MSTESPANDVELRAQLARANERILKLHVLATQLSAAASIDEVGRAVIAAATGALDAELDARWTAVWTIDGAHARLLAQHATPSDAEPFETIAVALDAPLPYAVRTAEPMFIESREVYARAFPAAEAITRAQAVPTEACVFLPLVVDGVVRAIVGCAFAAPHRFDKAERELLGLIARHAAIALGRALDAEAKATTAARLAKLQEATAALAEARTPHDVAAVTTRLGAEAVAADNSVIWLAQPDGSLLVHGNHNVPGDYLAAWERISPGGDLPANRVFEAGLELWVESAEDYARTAPDIFEHARAANRLRSFAVLPLTTSRGRAGVISFGFEARHVFAPDERAFLVALVRICEHALERARLFVAEAEARRLAESESRRKDEFLAMLGHELRNPLAAIVSALDVIKLRQPALDRELSILDRQAGHLTYLVGQLIEVSRISRGAITLERTAVDLTGIVEHAIDGARPQIARLEHQLTVDVPGGIVVDADRERLAQVLSNLLTNAASYTPPRGQIELRARDAGSFVEIEVRDNGLGIPASLLPHVFDVFVQGPRAQARTEGGLGIGLAIVRQLVTLHGGTVSVHSDGAGAGSTFTVRWPRATSETATVKMPALLRPEARRLRVLIVDDNRDAAELLGELIIAMGHEVLIAHDSETAIAAAAKTEAHVALLDLGLPVVDGYQLAQQLRALPGWADRPLVAVTGYGQPEDRERTQKAGFARHLVKPVELASLSALLAPLAADD